MKASWWVSLLFFSTPLVMSFLEGLPRQYPQAIIFAQRFCITQYRKCSSVRSAMLLALCEDGLAPRWKHCQPCTRICPVLIDLKSRGRDRVPKSDCTRILPQPCWCSTQLSWRCQIARCSFRARALRGCTLPVSHVPAPCAVQVQTHEQLHVCCEHLLHILP